MNVLTLLVLLNCMFFVVQSATNSSDVQALGNLYSSLNSPSQLSNWNSNGSDPCANSWKGITCSGSSVISIQIPGLRLNGNLGYLLSNMISLQTLDVSNNNIHDVVPYQLPPNLAYLNVANNNFTGNLPYSVTAMNALVYLNASGNSMSGNIEDIFANLKNMSQLDLSTNNFTGDLPNSFGSLSNLSSLYLQDNKLTGQLNILTNLSLTTLNIANNLFTGQIPMELKAIPNLEIGGNSFANNSDSPPPIFAPPPPSTPNNNNPNRSEGPSETPQNENEKKKSLTSAQIIGIVIGSLFGALFVLIASTLCLWVRRNNSLMSPSANAVTTKEKQMQEPKLQATLQEIPRSPKFTMIETMNERNLLINIQRSPITVTSYTVASLQSATNSFSQDRVVGEGSLGRVYRAEFSDGKVFAVKKIDTTTLFLQEEDNFLDVVSSVSKLRHPNVIELVGYCVEHGQRLLVYDYVGNRTLHDMLHYDEDKSTFSWNARIRVALGVAKALEYLHEVCVPSIIHRNLKSENILVDEELNPHLSDCGLATLTPETDSQISTEIFGSSGYSAPEYALSGNYTEKSDIYSFGVIMLELLTARKPLDSSRVRSERSLVRWATPRLHDIDALGEMVDPMLNGMYSAKSLSRFADIIALCVQPEPEFRPPMSEVVESLVRLMQRASIIRRNSSKEFSIQE